MANTISTLPFAGTAEQEARLDEVISAYKGQAGALSPVLQKTQEIYGYLPIEVEEKIAAGLGISLEKVYEVVTFYAQFAINPKGRYNISVCLGTACYVKGADKILAGLEERLGIKVGECTPDGLFSLDACRCVGACGLAPVMMIDDDVYGRMTVEQIDDILNKYRS